MSKIIDRSGKGSALTAADYDSNVDSMCGIVEAVTGTTYTVTVDGQNRTIEISNASPVAVTMATIASVTGANIHTSNFKIRFKNIGAGVTTITCGGADTFDDGSTAITLSQYESIDLQTDSAAAKWNISNRNHSKLDPDQLDDITAGTAKANSALVLGATKNIDTIDVAKDGLMIAGVSVTLTAAEANILDGATLSTAELNILDGMTRSTADINDLATKAGTETLDSKTLTEVQSIDGATGTPLVINSTEGGLFLNPGVGVNAVYLSFHWGTGGIYFGNGSSGSNANVSAAGIHTAVGFVGPLTGNADTVTTNANQTGDVTSVGNATTIAAAAVERAMITTATVSLAGSINTTDSVDITLNPYSFFPMLHSTTTGGYIALAMHTTDGASADNARLRLESQSSGTETYDIDYRYIDA